MTSTPTPQGAVRILVSEATRQTQSNRIRAVVPGNAELLTVVDVEGGAEFDVAFVSRDITGLSTKHNVLPDTLRFYNAMLNSSTLRWTHLHSAGADRPVFIELLKRSVTLTSAAGTNAEVVAQNAVAGVLALGRRFPELLAAQQRREWYPLIDRKPLPPDIRGQTATIVGWGGIGQAIGRILSSVGLRIEVVRSSNTPTDDGHPSCAYENISKVLPDTDWLILACPLSDRTRQLISADAIALMRRGSHVINVSRGDVIDELALIEALQLEHVAGAYLDVFAHEPLAQDSQLWTMPNVIATPHSAGFSSGNAERVTQSFLDNLRRFSTGLPMINVVR